MTEARLWHRSLLVVVAMAALIVFAPSMGFANNISTASAWPGSGGNVALTMPGDGHRVYRVPLEAGDWFIAYAWAPGTQNAAASIKLYDAGASEVASPSVAVSSSSGILFWQAPLDGQYYVGFAGAVAPTINCGLFRSHPVLKATTALTMVIGYNGASTLRARLTDPLYTYIDGDGPALGFEGVTLNRSSDGATWKAIFSHMTNINGDVSRRVTGIVRKSYFRFTYIGAVYDSAGLGEGQSQVVVVTPKVRLAQTVPASVRRGVAFNMNGQLRPARTAGLTPLLVQARRVPVGSPTSSLQFTVRALARRSGYSPIRATLTLPTKGTWAVRFYFPGDASNAKTSSPWVRIVVR